MHRLVMQHTFKCLHYKQMQSVEIKKGEYFVLQWLYSECGALFCIGYKVSVVLCNGYKVSVALCSALVIQ